VIDGGALAGVAGDGVGVVDVTGEVVEVKAAVFAVVGLYLDSHAASVIARDCRERAVVDVEAAVVAADDDPVANSRFATFGENISPNSSPRLWSRARAAWLSCSRVTLSRAIITTSASRFPSRATSHASTTAATASRSVAWMVMSSALCSR
jgi:hypothetical protein